MWSLQCTIYRKWKQFCSSVLSLAWTGVLPSLPYSPTSSHSWVAISYVVNATQILLHLQGGLIEDFIPPPEFQRSWCQYQTSNVEGWNQVRFLIEFLDSELKQSCCWSRAIYVQIWRWWSHTNVYDNTYFHSLPKQPQLYKKITFRCAQSATIRHPSGSLVSRPYPLVPPIRIPFHQFAPNQVTNSHSEEMGRILGTFWENSSSNFPFQTLVKDLKLADGVSNVIYFILRLVWNNTGNCQL